MVKSTTGSVAADKVVLCMAAYANDAWRGLRQSSIPVSTLQVSTDPLPGEFEQSVLPNGICVSDTHPLVRYFQQDPQVV